MDSIQLGWALHSSGRMIHINDSARGKKCNCVCPDCGGAVIARQGEVNAWCFSHAVDANCNGESVLHRVAKQIFEDCALNGDFIVLPAMNGSAYAKDYRGRLIEEEWIIPSKEKSIQFAKQEVSVRSDLRSDILAVIGTSNVAIEICVTHKKSDFDIQKYAAENISCMEIYLTKIRWDSSYAEIKLALLKNAPREWLFHHDAKALTDGANKILQFRLSEIEQIDRERIVSFANQIVKMEKSYLDLFDWPTVSGKFIAKVFGKHESHSASRVPRVTRFDSSVEIDGDVIRVKGVVNDKTQVTVFFKSIHGPKPDNFGDSAALIVFIDIGNDSKILPSMCKLKWINIQSWIKRLDDVARDSYIREQKIAEQNQRNFEVFRESFKSLNNQKRLEFLASKIDLSPPAYIGKVSPHWNTSWPIWRALVWYYSIEKRLGYRINIEFIAEWHWLAELLEWPSDSDSIVQRRKNIWFWFKELSSQNVLLHDGGLNFFVMNNLPSDVTPWSRQ